MSPGYRWEGLEEGGEGVFSCAWVGLEEGGREREGPPITSCEDIHIWGRKPSTCMCTYISNLHVAIYSNVLSFPLHTHS